MSLIKLKVNVPGGLPETVAARVAQEAVDRLAKAYDHTQPLGAQIDMYARIGRDAGGRAVVVLDEDLLKGVHGTLLALGAHEGERGDHLTALSGITGAALYRRTSAARVLRTLRVDGVLTGVVAELQLANRRTSPDVELAASYRCGEDQCEIQLAVDGRKPFVITLGTEDVLRGLAMEDKANPVGGWRRLASKIAQGAMRSFMEAVGIDPAEVDAEVAARQEEDSDDGSE